MDFDMLLVLILGGAIGWVMRGSHNRRTTRPVRPPVADSPEPILELPPALTKIRPSAYWARTQKARELPYRKPSVDSREQPGESLARPPDLSQHERIEPGVTLLPQEVVDTWPKRPPRMVSDDRPPKPPPPAFFDQEQQ